MTITEKIKEYFQKNNISFEGITHKPAASAEEYHNTLHTRYEQQAKALLVKYKNASGEKAFAVVTLQAQKRADLNHLQSLLACKELKLAHVDQLKAITGCNFGELPPLGKIFNLQLLMDKDLLNEEKIYFNAGSLDYSMIVNPKDIQNIESPIIF